MQLCSCLDHSSKEDESSSAKTWFLSTTGHPRIQLELFFTLVLLITVHLSNSPLQLLRPGCNLGALEQRHRNSLGPWSQRTLGFRSVTAEVPQCLPISHLMSFKDLRVTTETGDTLLKNTPLSIILRQNRSSTWCAGTCNLLTCDFIEKCGWEKLREKCTPCHSSSDTGSENLSVLYDAYLRP